MEMSCDKYVLQDDIFFLYNFIGNSIINYYRVQQYIKDAEEEIAITVRSNDN